MPDGGINEEYHLGLPASVVMLSPPDRNRNLFSKATLQAVFPVGAVKAIIDLLLGRAESGTSTLLFTFHHHLQ
jgi:hypothetical protein